jgi:MYXO-CTERM domain-containing protein
MRGWLLGLSVVLGACANSPRRELPRAVEQAAIGQTAQPVYTWTQRFRWPVKYTNEMVYDAARERTFLLCFHPDPLSSRMLGDTWEWNGELANWSLLGAGAEMLRNADNYFSAGGARAYDSQRKVTVFYDVLNGFWEWDGTASTWTLRGDPPSDVHQPFGMIYDAKRELFVLVGRLDPSAYDVGVWEWDPATATVSERAPTGTQPTGRSSAAVAWDAGRNKLVMFGGYGESGGATLDDLWEWDPTNGTWQDRTPSGTKPHARQTYASAYDDKLGHAFFFGGADPTYDNANPKAPLNDLWEWDGDAGQWLEHALAPDSVVPDGGYQYALVYDSKRQVLELFGGDYSESASGSGGQDAFDWDEASESWLDRRPPAGREAPVLAYDPKTKHEYLFGGYANTAGMLNDVWEYDGVEDAWSRRDSADPLPAARWYAAFVADEQRKRLLLVGGTKTGGTLMPGLWELEPVAGAWTNRASGEYPSVGYATMSYDPTRGRLLFFGGAASSSEASGTLWEWDGDAGTWTDRTGSDPKPSARIWPLSAFDAARNRLVVFGGADAQGVKKYDDTWEWNPDDGTWSERLPLGTFDPKRIELGMYYDDTRQRVVMVGGDPPGFSAGDGQLDTVWEWDGDAGNWAQIPVSGTSPDSRSAPGFTYDRARRAFVLYGGINSGAWHDQWELTVACPAGTDPCATTAPPPPPPDAGTSGTGGTSGRAGASGVGGASASAGTGSGASGGRNGAGGTSTASGGKAGRGGSANTAGTAGTEQDGGASSDGGNEEVTPKRSSNSDSGCGCRVGSHGANGALWVALSMLGAALARRRVRRGTDVLQLYHPTVISE